MVLVQQDRATRTEDARTDLQLVTGARAGARSAFGVLVERYQNLVCSFAYCITGGLVQSEEVAQDTFLAAWTQLPRLRRAESFRGWLLGIARNVSRQALKDQRAQRAGRSDASAIMSRASSGDPSPLDRIISGEEERALWRALNQLPGEYRLTFVLFYREDQSIPKLARLLEVSESSIKMRLARGRRILHEHVIALLGPALTKTRPGKELTAGVMLL